MHRTQLYIDDDAWRALQIVARQSGDTISALVRQAVKERYLAAPGDRSAVLESAIGLWRDRRDIPDGVRYVRRLRRSNRLARLTG